MPLFSSSCLPSTINQPKNIPESDLVNCFSKELQLVTPDETLDSSKNYYRSYQPDGAGDATITKIMSSQIKQEDLSAGNIYKQPKGWFFGGKRKSHIRRRKSRHTRKHHRKTRKYYRKK
uniref:Uncharacterized protein n=1 Tax=viral metagenome TaxID=1070528 RepID=A0A6C0HAY6_9ZZZZ